MSDDNVSPKRKGISPRELYAMPSLRTETRLHSIDWAFPELEYDYTPFDKNERIQLRVYAEEYLDSERSWLLCSVWLDDAPFMVAGCAGENRAEHQDRHITNKDLYNAAVAYLKSLSSLQEENADVVAEDEVIPYMTEFYGHSLEEFYVPETIHPRWNVGDVVYARIKKNSYSYTSEGAITTRVLIEEVFPHNPTTTYSGVQVDRSWEWKIGKVVEVPGEGTLAAYLSEGDVIEEAPVEPMSPNYKKIKERKGRRR